MAGTAASDNMMSQGWNQHTKDGNLEREHIQVLRWYFDLLNQNKQPPTYKYLIMVAMVNWLFCYMLN